LIKKFIRNSKINIQNKSLFTFLKERTLTLCKFFFIYLNICKNVWEKAKKMSCTGTFFPTFVQIVYTNQNFLHDVCVLSFKKVK